MVTWSSGDAGEYLRPCLRPAIVSDVEVEGRRSGPAFIVVGYGDGTAGLGSDLYLIQKLAARVERR
jgi:hypothetical protein